jgi:hypothetical protein
MQHEHLYNSAKPEHEHPVPRLLYLLSGKVYVVPFRIYIVTSLEASCMTIAYCALASQNAPGQAVCLHLSDLTADMC